MSGVFESGNIAAMALSNRFVRSATWEGLATKEGAVTPKLSQTMRQLSEGGVGLIISGHTYVMPDGQASPWQLGVYKDELIDGLKEMTEAVHAADAKIVMQLAHAGFFAPEALTGRPPKVVSDFEGLSTSPRTQLLIPDIEEIVNAYGQGAARAKSAGFDGVEIHSAHGYLLSQFLSPIYNRRTDEYGGSLANRARIHLEVLRAIRVAVGEDFPVLIKINCQDFAENGLSLEDSAQAAAFLAAAGLDAIEVSGGMLNGGKLSPSRPGINSEEKEAYFSKDLQAFRKATDIPLILVGGLRSLAVCERLIQTGQADYVAMSRPFIREPGLVDRWKSGDLRRAECASDNLCFRPGIDGEGIYCVTEKRQSAKK
ncbi:MAG: NADH:flavin oxidoreductase [Syntrophobacteraceae bacterium]|nr:NADH:flavin oxidoreductase [Syntrophobacteraceae bacterium]